MRAEEGEAGNEAKKACSFNGQTVNVFGNVFLTCAVELMLDW